MKVLHVVPSLALRHGGVSVSVRELCRGLAGLGVGVDLWSTKKGFLSEVDGPADRKLEEAGVRLRYFPVSAWPSLGERYAYSPALRQALIERVPQVDLVHIHMLWRYPTWAAARTCRRFGVPYVLSPCGALDPYSLGIRPRLKRLYAACVEGRTLRQAALLHFTSPLEQGHAFTFGAAQPTAVVPRSLETPEEFPPRGEFRARHPEIGNRKILLFLGRLHPKKGLDRVAEAFLRSAQRCPDTHLVIAGPDYGAAADTRRRLESAGLSGRVTFSGFLAGAEKWSAYQDASLFLLPSQDENFGVAVLEALRAGVPVLLSPQVGLAKATAEANAGLILPPDTQAWADTITALLENPERLRAMGENGRHLSENEFSSAGVARRMRDHYRKVVWDFRPGPEFASAWKTCAVRAARWLLNRLLEGVRAALWPRPRPRHPRRICIYRIGNIGDLACALPAMSAVRATYPKAHLTLLTSPGKEGNLGARELLAGAGWLDEMIVYHSEDIATPRGRICLIQNLRKRRFDLWIEFPNDLATLRSSLRNMLLAKLAGAGYGWGWTLNTLRWWARAQSERLRFANETDRLLQTVRDAGFSAPPQPAQVRPFQDSDRQSAERMLKSLALTNQPFVCLAPGAKRPLNRWPPEHFAEVGRVLASRGLGVLVLGGQGDASLCAEIAGRIGARAVSLAGQISLPEACAVLERCKLVICNDSGVQHLADLVGTRCVSIFSSWQQRTKWNPAGSGHTVLQPWVGCHTCLLYTCPYDNRCIKLIEPKEVISLLHDILSREENPCRKQH